MDILKELNQAVLPGHRVKRVSGWEALKKYPQARDTEDLYLDEDDEKDYLYMKRVEPDGTEICARYHYEPAPVEEFDPDKYTTVQDFEALKEQINNDMKTVREEFANGINSVKEYIEQCFAKNANAVDPVDAKRGKGA